MRRSNVILWGLIIALLALPVLGNMTSAADKTDKIKDYLTWLGSFEAPPVDPQPFGVYFNSLEGSSYIYDTDHWQLFAASGEDGEDCTSVDLTPLMDQIAALTARVEDLEEENEILNMRLEDLAPLASTVSSFTSSILEDQIHGASGQELQITVIVNNAGFHPILGLGPADFKTSIGTVVDAYDLAQGEYRVTVVINEPGTHTVGLTVDGILLQDTFSAVLANTVSAVYSEISTTFIEAPFDLDPHDSRNNVHYDFSIRVMNTLNDPITGLTLSDFDFGTYTSNVVEINEIDGEYSVRMIVTGEAFADRHVNYSLPVTVDGVYLGDIGVNEIDPFYPVGDALFEPWQEIYGVVTGQTIGIAFTPVNFHGHIIKGLSVDDFEVLVDQDSFTYQITEIQPYTIHILFHAPLDYYLTIQSTYYVIPTIMYEAYIYVE